MSDIYVSIIPSNVSTAIPYASILSLTKKPEPKTDLEEIEAFIASDVPVGIVANNVAKVITGTYSAGRLYDKFDQTIQAEVVFKKDEFIIAKVMFPPVTTPEPAPVTGP
ncbi:hypothetical protein D3C74_50220 [compost metagenome]